jgi:hypothetical protein
MPLALPGAARNGQQQRHGKIRGGVGEYFRRVGDDKAAGLGGFKVDVVKTDPEIADEPRAHGFVRQNLGVDGVGHRGKNRVGGAKRVFERPLTHRLVIFVELDIETLGKPRFHIGRPTSRDDHFGFAHGYCPGCLYSWWFRSYAALLKTVASLSPVGSHFSASN